VIVIVILMWFRQWEAGVMSSACYHVHGEASLVLLYSEVLEANAQVNLVSMLVQLWCKANELCRPYS